MTLKNKGRAMRPTIQGIVKSGITLRLGRRDNGSNPFTLTRCINEGLVG